MRITLLKTIITRREGIAMKKVTTNVCPGCAIKDNEDFSIINCLTCPHLVQSRTIMTETIINQRRVQEADEYNKI